MNSQRNRKLFGARSPSVVSEVQGRDTCDDHQCEQPTESQKQDSAYRSRVLPRLQIDFGWGGHVPHRVNACTSIMQSTPEV